MANANAIPRGGDQMDHGAVERTRHVTVPLVAAILSFTASVLSAVLLFYVGSRSNSIDLQLAQIHGAQATAEQAAREAYFNRESERQYVALFYQDILSTDTRKQRAALELVEILEPSTGLKLLAWATKAGVLLPENRSTSQQLETVLTARVDNGQYEVYLHVFQPRYPVGNGRSRIETLLGQEGYRVRGVDSETQKYPPRIDYFHDSDLDAARRIADILNPLRAPQQQQLVLHRREAKNPTPGVIGVWY